MRLANGIFARDIGKGPNSARFRPLRPVPCGARLQHIVATTPAKEKMPGYQLVNSSC
jgi:hypothetical protein